MEKIEYNLGFLLNKTTHMIKMEFNKKLEDYSLTSSQWAVMRDIYSQEYLNKDASGVTPAAIAHRLSVERPAITGILSRLARGNWIIMKVNPRDRRSQMVDLTEKSLRVIKDLEKLSNEVIEKAFVGFPKEDVDNFKTYLVRIIDNFSM